jgi:hypothetical protein
LYPGRLDLGELVEGGHLRQDVAGRRIDAVEGLAADGGGKLADEGVAAVAETADDRAREPMVPSERGQDNEKPPGWRLSINSLARRYALFDLGFLEDDVLAGNRIVFLELELFGLGAWILLGHIEKAGVGAGHHLDQDRGRLSHGLFPIAPPDRSGG